MGDPAIENCSLVPSTSSTEAPMCSLPEEGPQEAAPLSSVDPSLSQDSYTAAGALSSLSLDSSVRVNSSLGSREVTVQSLLLEAGRGSERAQDELQGFIENRLASLGNTNQLNECFDACEENTLNVITQLNSDDATHRQEAAITILAMILGDSQGNLAPVSPELARGLIVAAAIINNQESRQLLVAVDANPYGRKLLQSISVLPNRGEIQQAIARSRHSQPNQGPAPLRYASAGALSLGGGELVRSGTITEINSPATANGGVLATTSYENLLAQVSQVLSDNVHPRSDSANFLGSTSKAGQLAHRVTQLLSRSDLNASQLQQSIYYATLSRGFGHAEFTSANEHYAELRPVAAGIARDIVARLGLAESKAEGTGPLSPNSETYAVANRSSRPGSTSSVNSASGVPQSSGNGPSLEFFYGDSASQANPYLVPASTLAAAGLQGLPLMALALGSRGSSLGFSGTNRPHYYVEASSSTSGDTHSGSQDGSSNGQQNQQGQESPDAYA